MEGNMNLNQYDGINKNLQPPPPPHPNCPRCESANTKFSYYNNYSVTQPRYYCRNCRRYWTQGGALRDVPVGGGSRKEKRAKTSSGQSSSLTTESLAQAVPPPPVAHPQLVQGHDLGVPDINSGNFFYPEGTILTSVTAIQAINQPLVVNPNSGNTFEENVTVFQSVNFSATIPQVLPSQFNTEFPPTHSALVSSWSPSFGNMGGGSTSAGVGDISGSGNVRVNNNPHFNPNWSFYNGSQNHPGFDSS